MEDPQEPQLASDLQRQTSDDRPKRTSRSHLEVSVSQEATFPTLPTTWEVDPTQSMTTERLKSPISTAQSPIRKRSPSMGHFFVREKEKVEVQHDDGWVGKAKKYATILVEGNYTANFLALVVLLDAYLTANDIDSRASQEETSPLVLICSDICLILYTCELPLLILVRGKRLLKDWMVILDIAIILCGYVEMLVNFIDRSSGVDPDDSESLIAKIGVLRVLRLARIVRLMQLLRRSRSLKELQKLVTMLATCLKALLWSFLFCFVIMTIWAMLLVEIVHPIVLEIQEEFQGCEQCLRATGSVMDANLLLFKTVIAGDSWGKIAVPVIEAYPGTAIIFCGSLLTLVFGVLNMIVAVVVDTFAEVRESDVMNLAEELDHNLKRDRKFLEKIFNRLDKSGNGELTLQDLMDGARRDPEFQSRLRVMDIDEVDLQQLFDMIDSDGSGAIEAQEFIAPLSRWVRESKTAPRFVKYNMMVALQQQEEMIRLSHFQYSQLALRLDDLCERMGKGRSSMESMESIEVIDPDGVKETNFAFSRELTETQATPQRTEAYGSVTSVDKQSLATVQENWTPEVVGNIEQPQKSESGFLQLGLKEERRSQTDARRNGSRGPTAKQLELKQLELKQLELKQLELEQLQLRERELEQPNHSHEAKEHKEGREAQPSRERRRSYGSSIQGFLDRIIHPDHHDDEVKAAASHAMEVYAGTFDFALKMSFERAHRQAVAKAEAVLQECLGGYNSTSWNQLSAPDAVRSRLSSASTISLSPVPDMISSSFSRQVSKERSPSHPNPPRRRSLRQSEPVSRPKRPSYRMSNASGGGIWGTDS